MRAVARGVVMLLLVGAVLAFIGAGISVLIGVGKVLQDPDAEPTCDKKTMRPGTECVHYKANSMTEVGSTSYAEALEEQRGVRREGVEYLEVAGAMAGGSVVVFVGGAFVLGALDGEQTGARGLRRGRRVWSEASGSTRSGAMGFDGRRGMSQEPEGGGSFVDIGRTYEARGELFAAEECYRRGAVLGDTAAMDRLARLLHDRVAGQSAFVRWRNRGRNRVVLAEAEMWLREAAGAGNAQAMAALGALLEEQGAGVEAERWYRLAINGGDGSAMNNLGLLLFRRGDHAGARQWWNRAAAAGSAAALRNLKALPAGTPLPARAGPVVGPTRPGSMPSGTYADLLRLVMNDRATADRLIEYERQLTPQAGRPELIHRAIDRLRHDRNR